VNHRDYFLQAFDKWMEGKDLGGALLDVGARDTCLKQDFEDRGFIWNAVDPFPQSPEIRTGYMEALPYPDKAFDIVVCVHSFEHCERPVDALKEMFRVLSPGGYLYIATPMVCKHQILEADTDHVFVLLPMQFARLLLYTGFSEITSNIWPGDIEQNHTVCSVGRRP